MPIEVDAAKRLDRIAEATLRVAGRDGPGGITIRAVAAELGGSTTVVTNYIKSRADLLANAVRYEQRNWHEDTERSVSAAGDNPRDRLYALIRWSTSTDPDDIAARQIWMDLVSRAPEAGASVLLREDAAEHHQRFCDLLEQVSPGVAAFVADALYLAVRGFYFATTEDPERWPSGRAEAAILRMADAFLAERGLPGPSAASSE